MQRMGLLMTAAVFALALVSVAHAATTFTVTTTTDDAVGNAANCTGVSAASTCSLRDAVAAADASPGATVQLGAQTYDLSHGQLDLTAAMTLAGQGASATEIEQSGSARVLAIAPTTAGSSVTVSGVEITGGDVTGTAGTAAQGGGVLVDPNVSGVTVTLTGDLLTQNYAYGATAVTPGTNGGAAEGGGIAVESTHAPSLTLSNTTVSINTVRAGDADSSETAAPGAGGEADGGGVQFASAGTLTVTGGAITGNYATGGQGGPTTNVSGHEGGDGGDAHGAGLEVAGALALSGTTVEDDVAQGGTGGNAGGTQAEDGFGGSASGGGILAEAATTIAGAEITGDQIQLGRPGSEGFLGGGTQGEGGGVELARLGAPDSSDATISSSTIANDTASYETAGDGVGGGIADGAARFTLENSTVEGNSAQGLVSGFVEGAGGGVDIEGTATLASDTIVANQTLGSGGNLYAQSSTVTATDTIVADGTGTAGVENCDATSTSIGDLPGHGNNLESDATGECGFTGPSDVHAEPQLGSLALNGGATETMLPASASPAIGAGGACIDPVTSARLALDERGAPRPTGSGACDIGAVQTQPPLNTGAPTIGGGAAVGQTLNCGTGTWTGDGTLTYTYQWLRGTTPLTTGATYVVAGADAGQALTCTVTATTAYGTGAATSSPVAVPIPTVPGPTTTPLGRPKGTPGASVSSFRESASKWRTSGKASRHKPVGTTFTFALSEAATVRLTFSQPGVGRRVSRRCVAQSAKDRRRPSCTLAIGTLTLAGKTGENAVKFTGRLSGGRELLPGRYTVTIMAQAAGASSKPIALQFTVVA
jgi:hypothetical protein